MTMPYGLLVRVPLAALFLAILGAMFLTAHVGRRMGERTRKDCDVDARAHAGALQAAVLGLLALMLGFTFSMAQLRFETNRDLVVAEANAIKAVYLRADTVAEPERSRLKALVRPYTETRVEFYLSGLDLGRRAAADDESDRLQAEMWRQAAASAARAPTCITALLVDAVNKVIAMHDTRIDAASSHVPEEILWLLAVMAPATTWLTGYVAGFGNRRLNAPTAIAFVLIALVIAVIIDLDRPLRGLIQGGQDSMLHLRAALWRQR